MNKQIADKKVKIAALKALIKLYKEKLCEPTPCLNGGKCFMGECHCAEGWTGTHCKERGQPEYFFPGLIRRPDWWYPKY